MPETPVPTQQEVVALLNSGALREHMPQTLDMYPDVPTLLDRIRELSRNFSMLTKYINPVMDLKAAKAWEKHQPRVAEIHLDLFLHKRATQKERNDQRKLINKLGPKGLAKMADFIHDATEEVKATLVSDLNVLAAFLAGEKAQNARWASTGVSIKRGKLTVASWGEMDGVAGILINAKALGQRKLIELLFARRAPNVDIYVVPERTLRNEIKSVAKQFVGVRNMRWKTGDLNALGKVLKSLVLNPAADMSAVQRKSVVETMRKMRAHIDAVQALPAHLAKEM